MALTVLEEEIPWAKQEAMLMKEEGEPRVWSSHC